MPPVALATPRVQWRCNATASRSECTLPSDRWRPSRATAGRTRSDRSHGGLDPSRNDRSLHVDSLATVPWNPRCRSESALVLRKGRPFQCPRRSRGQGCHVPPILVMPHPGHRKVGGPLGKIQIGSPRVSLLSLTAEAYRHAMRVPAPLGDDPRGLRGLSRRERGSVLIPWPKPAKITNFPICIRP